MLRPDMHLRASGANQTSFAPLGAPREPPPTRKGEVHACQEELAVGSWRLASDSRGQGSPTVNLDWESMNNLPGSYYSLFNSEKEATRNKSKMDLTFSRLPRHPETLCFPCVFVILASPKRDPLGIPLFGGPRFFSAPVSHIVL